MGARIYLPHLQEDVADLFAHFEERVQGTAIWRKTFGFEVVLLVRGRLPRATAAHYESPPRIEVNEHVPCEHINSEVGLGLCYRRAESRALLHREPLSLSTILGKYEAAYEYSRRLPLYDELALAQFS